MLIVKSIAQPQAMNNRLKLSIVSRILNKKRLEEKCQPILSRSRCHVINYCQMQNPKLQPMPWMCNLNARSFSTTSTCSISKSPGDPKAPLNMFLLFAIAGSLFLGYELVFGDGGPF